jgi:hypothetical protein
VPVPTTPWQTLFWDDKFAPKLAILLLLQRHNGYKNQEDPMKEISDALKRKEIPFTRIEEFIGNCGLGVEKVELEEVLELG